MAIYLSVHGQVENVTTSLSVYFHTLGHSQPVYSVTKDEFFGIYHL